MPKPLINIAILLVLTLGLVYANTNLKTETSTPSIDYKNMSTTQLQIKVEKLSNQGVLPFEMGRELMSRWAESKKEIN